MKRRFAEAPYKISVHWCPFVVAKENAPGGFPPGADFSGANCLWRYFVPRTVFINCIEPECFLIFQVKFP